MHSPILVTGAAGFIGFHTIMHLIQHGATQVIGLDNINDYYDVGLKYARLEKLAAFKDAFHFEKVDIADKEALDALFKKYQPKRVIHLAAQAGVRYSIEHPQAYIDSNLIGFMNILEAVRHHQIEHLTYASSSSVYGANTKLPFSTLDQTDTPVSLYAATKKSNEALAFSYSTMYQIPMTGLRFFTVYGPYGRPDMAYFKFTQSLYANKPITVYNNGNMMRDFTYIDDIVRGVVASAMHIPETKIFGQYKTPHMIYNIGHNHPENLGEMIEMLEDLTGKTAQKDYQPMQTGDVLSTYADITEITRDLGFVPQTSLREGLQNFVEWYKAYYGVV
ncbi:MAG: NAD-dependent epimerase/dehydratase family protein [Alphaproteobacteria bacterium]|nr:MAG: NAD-dependent epimerase/dehydratase family protein [Alphaproteobacteria bacterium]